MGSINFHQTFPPSLEYISRILEITDMENELTKDEISVLTGIPTGKSSGKVEPSIEYAKFMGLIQNESNTKGKYRLKLTSLGSVIKKEDIALNEEISQLICHIRLTSPSTGAVLWNSVARKILPKYTNGISGVILEDELKKISDLATVKVKMGPFNSTYLKSFDRLKLVDKDKSYYSRIAKILITNYNRIQITVL